MWNPDPQGPGSGHCAKQLWALRKRESSSDQGRQKGKNQAGSGEAGRTRAGAEVQKGPCEQKPTEERRGKIPEGHTAGADYNPPSATWQDAVTETGRQGTKLLA